MRRPPFEILQNFIEMPTFSAGVHGPVPTNTSRYVSTDFGLIHLVGLDLNELDAG